MAADFIPATYVEHYSKGAFAPYVVERNAVAGSGIWMLDVVQPAGAFPDPPVPEFVLERNISAARADIDFGAGRFTMRRGEPTIAVAPPMCASDIVVHDPHHIQILTLPTARLARWSEDECHGVPTKDLGRLHTQGLKSVLIEQLMDRLWSDAGRPDGKNLLQTDAVLLTLWSELLRESRLAPRTVARGGLAPWQLRRCVEYIAAHAHENIGLDRIAAVVGLSTFHFARAFKESTGVPPYRYQLAIRIDRAKSALETTDKPITQIALDVGYESSQALARAFQREVGVPPTVWRRERHG